MATGVNTSTGRNFHLYRCIAKPAMVPRMVELRLAHMAITSELRAAVSISWLLSSALYQYSVKPTHSAFSRESLNEYITTIASGT